MPDSAGRRWSRASGRLREVYEAARMSRELTGRWPRVVSPVTHTDHLFWYKTCFRDPVLPLRQDKVRVKRYVARTIGPEYVIPTLWHGVRLPRRRARDWPRPFVLKANHGCGFNVFVGAEGRIPWLSLERRTTDWLSQTYGAGPSAEWGYSQIEPRLLVEPLLGDPVARLPEYKFWTFDGRVHYFQASERVGGRYTTRHFDRDGVRQPYLATAPPPPPGSERPLPPSLPEMMAAAERLADRFPFVRVDFYEVDDRPLFSEMTFYPNGAFAPLYPQSYDVAIGRLWPSPPRTLRSLPLRLRSLAAPGSVPWTRR